MPSSRASEANDRSAEQRVAEAREPRPPDEGERRQGEPGVEEGDGGPDADARGGDADELARMEDRYKRALADLDNYRKRAARETERRIAESREAQLRDWLEVVDSLERALLMQQDDPVTQGLRAVLDQMEAVLARQGVSRMGAEGERFDPERHEAIGVRPTNEVPDRTVVEVGRSGFELGDRMLRPAQVIVSRAQEDNG